MLPHRVGCVARFPREFPETGGQVGQVRQLADFIGEIQWRGKTVCPTSGSSRAFFVCGNAKALVLHLIKPLLNVRGDEIVTDRDFNFAPQLVERPHQSGQLGRAFRVD